MYALVARLRISQLNRAVAVRIAASVTVLLIAAGVGLADEPAKGGPKKPAPTAEQIVTWVGQLDADEFLARETAMLELLEAGPAVLAHLKPVLSGGSLEATSRALYLLRQFALAADFDAQDQAGALLAELAERKETPALARRAAAALEELSQQRQLRALADLEGLGAKVTRGQLLNGRPLEEAVQSIKLDSEFRGQEDDLRRLKWVHDVPVLMLAGDQVSDGWIKHAAQMPGLRELHVYQARISDAGLAPLAESAAGPSLAQVGFYYTPVGDAVLGPLTKLPVLNFVKLFGTQITSKGERDFMAAAGVIRVDRRRGAFLGIGSLQIDGTCLISKVHEGSPADTGGLLREDVIIRFGDAKVTNFESLTNLIAQRAVEEEVEIEIRRRSLDEQGNPMLRNVAVKVKLMPWELELAVNNGPRP